MNDVMNAESSAHSRASPLARHGFSWCHTGGGCTAIERIAPDGGTYAMATGDDGGGYPDAIAPQAGQPVTVGVYDNGDNWSGEPTRERWAESPEALAANPFVWGDGWGENRQPVRLHSIPIWEMGQ